MRRRQDHRPAGRHVGAQRTLTLWAENGRRVRWQHGTAPWACLCFRHWFQDDPTPGIITKQPPSANPRRGVLGAQLWGLAAPLTPPALVQSLLHQTFHFVFVGFLSRHDLDSVRDSLLRWLSNAAARVLQWCRAATTGHNMWFRLVPEDQVEKVQRNRPETIESSRDPEQEFFAACRGGQAPWSNFDYADALNEFLMLGNVATQFESTLEFDPVAMKIVNNPAADALLRCEYRPGWTL